jgi:mannose-1-phosphate guanylyltransferase
VGGRLAGGEGVRLQSLTRELYGEARPKQYCAFTGSTSRLRTTLDRVARLIPPECTVAVTQASHAAHTAVELAGHPAITVPAQPCNRGTAAGVLLAAHWIRNTLDFSRAVLAPSTIPLVVAEVPALTWCDLGTPERVARALGAGARHE